MSFVFGGGARESRKSFLIFSNMDLTQMNFVLFWYASECLGVMLA